MRVAVLCIVADTPATEITPDRRIQAYRDPAPGELYAHARTAFARLEALVARENLTVVTDRAGLHATIAPAAPPAVLVASEGADFLDGRLERVAEAFERHRLRLLQLVHYRVNELGDIQTADRVHNGLREFGAAVIRDCNRRGIAVDVAHGTIELVRRAAEVTTKPLILSHTSLAGRPGPRSRQVTAEHARLVAQTGGVIGIWPPGTIFPDLAAYARGVARMAEAVGIDHVGIGSDMLGLLGPAAYGDYAGTPALAEALAGAGFGPAEVAKVLGGNARRVLMATLPG
jgi:membrane dipeptidase